MMAVNEKFNGDCKLLQDLLRRFAELKGGEVRELSDNTIISDMAYDTTLTLFAKPICECEHTSYGFIGYKERIQNEAYIDENNVQYLYEELNKAIAKMEQQKQSDR